MAIHRPLSWLIRLQPLRRRLRHLLHRTLPNFDQRYQIGAFAELRRSLTSALARSSRPSNVSQQQQRTERLSEHNHKCRLLAHHDRLVWRHSTSRSWMQTSRTSWQSSCGTAMPLHRQAGMRRSFLSNFWEGIYTTCSRSQQCGRMSGALRPNYNSYKRPSTKWSSSERWSVTAGMASSLHDLRSLHHHHAAASPAAVRRSRCHHRSYCFHRRHRRQYRRPRPPRRRFLRTHTLECEVELRAA